MTKRLIEFSAADLDQIASGLEELASNQMSAAKVSALLPSDVAGPASALDMATQYRQEANLLVSAALVIKQLSNRKKGKRA